MPGTGLLVAILAVLLGAATVAAEDCAVRYSNAGRKPLLFGGVLDRCIAGCAPRTSQWAQICAFKRESDPKMVCTVSAANHSLALVGTLGGGEALQLSPCDLVRYLRGRTLWLIGDSHARFFYRALQCFLLDFWNQQECQATLDSQAEAQLADMPAAPGGAYCFHLMGAASGRVCMVHVVLGSSLVENPQVAEGGVLPLLQQTFAQPQDIFYINFGIWHKNMERYESTYLPALEALARFYKATKARFPHVVFGETPAQHQRDGSGQQCAAAAGFIAAGSSTANAAASGATSGAASGAPPTAAAMAAEQAASSYQQAWDLGIVVNKLANEVLPRAGIPVLPFFNITVPLHDSHASIPLFSGKLDCMHYCHPGAPQMWVWFLYDFLRSPQGVQPLPAQGSANYSLPCRVMKSAA
ncbi:hypothetical protein OEZ85_005734 [Tetradesmus obliquus]|uniref:SGNH domain-containing protein n=1 Tax=Tetradesmus obliquus TaxID=3088 RepID=A0ABY8UEA3_TETOB|nr:hypothetical protein OEZ85_005734 [Tetradesmus obliquus]